MKEWTQKETSANSSTELTVMINTALTGASGATLPVDWWLRVPARSVALYLRLRDHSGLTRHYSARPAGVAPLGPTRMLNSFVNTTCACAKPVLEIQCLNTSSNENEQQ
jgi:hypothetical protein